MAKNFVIRRTTDGWDRAASSYVVRRPSPSGKGAKGTFRFAKTSLVEAEKFDEGKARKILRSLKREDQRKDESTYAIVEA